jgi:hypothetical protein
MLPPTRFHIASSGARCTRRFGAAGFLLLSDYLTGWRNG